MAETPFGGDVTQDLSSDTTSIIRVAEEFDFAWQQTLHGQPPPDIDLATAKVPENAQSALRKLLQDIVKRYSKADDVSDPSLVGETIFTAPNVGQSQAYIEAPGTCETMNLSASLDGERKERSLPPSEGSIRSRSFWERGDRKSIGPKMPVDFDGEDGDEHEDEASDFSVDPALEVRPSHRKPPPTLPGYEIVGQLGRGGMGVVYRARQIGLNRTVALKMVLAGGHASPEQFERFRAEAESVAQLQHPNIVQVFDVGEQDGLPFFSLEFVDGPSLEKSAGGKPQMPRYAAALTEQLARAMQHAHDHGLVHRDLKPANILLTSQGLPKITDFGLVKRLEDDSSQTRTGTIMGTPSYMAPEQGRGEHDIGPAADIYALGSILYALLTGRPPFMAPKPLETVMQLLKQEPVPPSRLQPHVPRDLETICLKCLQKDPKKRYETSLELAEDLRRFQAREPIRARRVSRAERAWRWCRRNPRVAALSTAVAILLITVASTLSLGAMRAARERETIRNAREHARERLAQATLEARTGNIQRANDVLAGVAPLIHESAELSDVQAQVTQLQQQLHTFSEFRRLLDNARYHVLLGGPSSSETAREICRTWIQLSSELEDERDRGRFGWPPLNDYQRAVLQEDLFEGYLLAAKAECDAALASGNDTELKEATTQAITWLNRLEQQLPNQRVLYVHRAAYYGMAGEDERSSTDAEQAKSIEPTTAVDHFWHGFADYLRGEEAKNRGDGKAAGEHYRLAIDQYARLIRLRPTNPWGYLMSANCQLALGRTHDAIINLTTSVQLRPDAPFGYNNRAFVLQVVGQHREALDDFSAAIERDPRYAIAYTGRAEARRALNEPSAAVLTDFDRAIELQPKDPRALLARAGYAFDVLHDYALAQQDFAALRKLSPEDPFAHYRHGLASMKRRDFDQALVDFLGMEERLPNSPDAQYLQAVIHLGRREYEAASAKLESALRLKPDYIDAIAARGHLRLRMNQLEEALNDANELVRLAANNAGILIERADAYFAMQRWNEAAADYKLCIQLDPKLLDAYVGLARAQMHQGNTADVVPTYDQMVSANPQTPLALVRRAEYYRDQGQLDLARADAQAAAKLDSTLALVHLLLASIDAADGKLDAAIRSADEILSRSPEPDGNVLYAAACVWSVAATKAADDRASFEKYAARAADLLTAALGSGFHDMSYQTHNRMRSDPALQSILNRTEVQQLLFASVP